MFFNRLKWFTILMTVIAVVILVRLVDVQVVRAAQFEALADRMLTRPIVYLAAPRGSILDCQGRVLVSDEPTADVSVHYALLLALTQAGEPGAPDRLPPETQQYLRAVARELRRLGEAPEGEPIASIVARLERQVDASWDRLCGLTGVTPAELADRARRIVEKVQAVKRYVKARTPTVRDVAEEHALHPLIADIDPEAALKIRLELEPFRWISVVPSSRRVVHDADTLVHVLGRLGAASPPRIEADPLAGDELRGLRAGDLCGVSGVERLAELTLRGTRGRLVQDFDRRKPPLEQTLPVPGRDVSLTIDAEVQRFAYDVVRQAVDESEFPCGGSAVVLDVHTREVLALVSYPVYAYDEYNERYDRLRDDLRWRPLRFRAVANMYPPGSTCKIITLYGALADGLIGPDAAIRCDGVFRDNLPHAFRCWIYNTYRSTHGPQDAEAAIRNSCNIYFYTIGDRLGPERLCHWFEQFGLGRTQGSGLIEESPGLVPDAEWMSRNRPADPRFRAADAWNYAIGQGEVNATPLQSANAVASVAAGRWEPVKLLLDARGVPVAAADAPPARSFDERILRTIRRGMWKVVNDAGTAKVAKLDTDGYQLCGKTGSAQAIPRQISYKWTLEWPDGRREEVIAGLNVPRSQILERFAGAAPAPTIVGRHTYERYPPLSVDEKLPSHAWFVGYTQPAERAPSGAPPRGPSYAIALILEYGGSGGRDAGPAAKALAEFLVSRERLRGDARQSAPGGRGPRLAAAGRLAGPSRAAGE